MPLDSDIYNADEQLQVEFYLAKEVDPKWDGKPFVRINIPGDKTTIIEQPMTEDHKKRFPRQYLYLNRRNRSETENQLDETKKQLAELQAQMASLLARKPAGRPKKEAIVES